MTISQKTLDIFKADVEVIVIPVNTAGAMGRGLALQFKWRFEQEFFRYRKICKDKGFGVNQLLPMKLHNGQIAVFFPTKKEWWNPSNLEWVTGNLKKLSDWCRKVSITRMAIPPVGCGEGGLDFDLVRDLIFSEFDDHPTDVVFTVSAGNYRKVLN